MIKLMNKQNRNIKDLLILHINFIIGIRKIAATAEESVVIPGAPPGHRA